MSHLRDRVVAKDYAEAWKLRADRAEGRVAELVPALVDLRGAAETLYIRSRLDERDPEMKRAMSVIATANKVIDAHEPAPSVGTTTEACADCDCPTCIQTGPAPTPTGGEG